MQSNPYVSSLSDGVLTEVLEHHVSGQASDLYVAVKTWNCEVWLIYIHSFISDGWSMKWRTEKLLAIASEI